MIVRSSGSVGVDRPVSSRTCGTLPRTGRAGFAFLTIVAFPGNEDQQHGVRVARAMCQPNAAQLAAIRDMVEAGQIAPRIAQVFAFDRVKEALALSEGGEANGKIVLSIANPAGGSISPD